MRDYFVNTIHQFVNKVFPDCRFLEVGLSNLFLDQYDYIWVKREDQIENYYDRLAPGGIIAGEGKTDYFGDDISYFDTAWFHVKPAQGDYPFTPVVLTIDRTELAKKELDKWGIKYEFFEGIRHKAGHIGCGRSYVEIFKKYQDDRPLLVLEDDVKFVRNPHTLSLEGLPEWDAVYLGANIRTPCENGLKHFSRMFSAWTTHAIIWSKSLREKVINEYVPEHGLPIDEWLNRQMGILRMYVAKPFYAVQRPGVSTITQAKMDYVGIFNSQNRMFV